MPNISIIKGNQTMKLGQLIEYYMRSIFLEKSYRKYDRETIPRHFSEKPKWIISLDQQSEFLFSLFYCISKMMNTKMY